MVVASSSPVQFSKIVFMLLNFVQSLKMHYNNNFCQLLWITWNLTFLRLVSQVAESEEIL